MALQEIREVGPGSADYEAVLALAESLDQKRYLLSDYRNAQQRILLGAFDEGDRSVGFLFALVQIVGSDEDRPPLLVEDQPMTECYVEAFGVLPESRRLGIGQALQENAIRMARHLGCYQIRSRSPVEARENYGLKLKMGYVLHPSNENDSYYFIRKL